MPLKDGDTPLVMQKGNKNTDPLHKGLHDLAAKKYQHVHHDAIAMIETDVHDPIPYCLLAMIAAAHDNHIKAEQLFARAVELGPDMAHFYAYHAQELTVLGQHKIAKQQADMAVNLGIHDAFIADTIGVVYSKTGFQEKAIRMFEQAISLYDAPANFHYNMGASLQFLGQFEEAKAAYSETISRDPDHFRALSSLVSLERQCPGTNHLDLLTKMFERHQDDDDARLHLGHGIAKTLEDLDRYEESLSWLQKAKQKKLNQLHRGALSYGPLFAAAKTPASKPAQNTSPDAPIFVFGLPRTGTTLVDRILSSHPDVVAAGELNVFAALVKETVRTRSDLVLDPETLQMAGAHNIDQIGYQYMQNTRELARGAKRMTDKMPFNFFYAGLIHRTLPNARMVVLRRGAMDSCLSNYRQLFTIQRSYYTYSYQLEATARFYRHFDDLIGHWRETLPKDRFMEVRYEDIVFDQENQTRNLLDFCDLSWDDACMRFHENTAPVATASSVQVRQPLYSGSIGRWKKYGDGLDELKQALGNLAELD